MGLALRTARLGAWTYVSGLLLVASVGCAQGKCDALCGSATVFKFDPPILGDTVRFEVDGHVLECDPECPSDPTLRASTTATDAIERLTWSEPSRSFHIRVKVDGATTIDRKLSHRPQDEHNLCGMICRNAEFTLR